VPSDELLVGSIGFSHRHQQASAPVNDAANAVLVVCLSRHQDPEVVTEPDQPAIEHPVRRSGQSKTVADDVGSDCFAAIIAWWL
jgi:hypothetical protein